MTDTPLWQLPAHQLARLTRSGELSVAEVIRDAVEHMEAVNPGLNAVVDTLAEQAMERAVQLDNAVARGGRPGPLHGVPVTIKINVDQKGRATSNGVTAFADLIAPDDAPVVRNLLTAGAVVIGRTNTPEFSFRAETDNPLHGRTHNPWGDHVSPGGSSGGAGAAVMAGIGALAHGNDIGGSLRFPAAANGAVTVKPGLGRVPAWNPSQKAERGMLAQAMSVQGILTRTAADLDLAMPSLIGPDPHDPFHAPVPWEGPQVSRPIRVAFSKETFGFALHPEVSIALDAAAAALDDAGYEVEEITPPQIHDAGRIGYRTLLGEVKALMGPDIAALGSHVVRDIFADYWTEFPPFEGTELLQMMAQRSQYARDFGLFQQEYPLVLSPFLPQPFFRPDRDREGVEGLREVLGAAIWSYSMNFMGLPAGIVPARLALLPQGPYPIGVQITGRRWREDLVVQALAAIEAAVGPMAPRLWAMGG
jgi:amidase